MSLNVNCTFKENLDDLICARSRTPSCHAEPGQESEGVFSLPQEAPLVFHDLQLMQFMQTEQLMQFAQFVLVYQKSGTDGSGPVLEQTA